MRRFEFEHPVPSPAQRELCGEFAAWCARHGLPCDRGAEDPLLTTMLSRDQRMWLQSFIGRWDWQTERAARSPAALRTPIELAGVFMAVAREHSSRGEFARVLSGVWRPADYLDVGSVMDLAFARLHHVPVGDGQTLEQRRAAASLKAAAFEIVTRNLSLEDAPCPTPSS